MGVGDRRRNLSAVCQLYSQIAEWKWLSIFLLNINTKGELVYEMESR